MLRRLLLACSIVGGLLLAFEFPPDINVLPLPGANLTDKFSLRVPSAGDYDLLISMAKVGDHLGLKEETIPCDLSLRVDADGRQVASRSISAITLGSEYGYAHTQQYYAQQPFHLPSGEYDVVITGGAHCPAATARGASVTVERQEQEHILGSLLYYAAARLLLGLGLLGLIIQEFRRGPNKRWKGP